MQYYAHTAELPDGRPDRNQGNWQVLSSHLLAVSRLAADFAAPFPMETEAALVEHLRDLGKYSDRFQARLRNPAQIRGINHWAAGAFAARKLPHASVAADEFRERRLIAVTNISSKQLGFG